MLRAWRADSYQGRRLAPGLAHFGYSFILDQVFWIAACGIKAHVLLEPGRAAFLLDPFPSPSQRVVSELLLAARDAGELTVVGATQCEHFGLDFLASILRVNRLTCLDVVAQQHAG